MSILELLSFLMILLIIIKLSIFLIINFNLKDKRKLDYLKLKEPINKTILFGLATFLMSILIYNLKEIESSINDYTLVISACIVFCSLLINNFFESFLDKRIKAYTYLILRINEGKYSGEKQKYKEDNIPLNKLLSEFSCFDRICIILNNSGYNLILKKAAEEYDEWVENDYKEKENFIFKIK